MKKKEYEKRNRQKSSAEIIAEENPTGKARASANIAELKQKAIEEFDKRC